jgi:hypothetical protein
MLDGVTSFVKAKRNSGKRVCFDIIHLEEWLKWADKNGFLFTNTENGTVDGVVVIYPVGKFEETPTLGQVLGRCGFKDSPTDYFIMDALVDNPLARSKICTNICLKFPLIESDTNSNLWCQKGDKIIKLSKNHTINLKN